MLTMWFIPSFVLNPKYCRRCRHLCSRQNIPSRHSWFFFPPFGRVSFSPRWLVTRSFCPSKDDVPDGNKNPIMSSYYYAPTERPLNRKNSLTPCSGLCRRIIYIYLHVHVYVCKLTTRYPFLVLGAPRHFFPVFLCFTFYSPIVPSALFMQFTNWRVFAVQTGMTWRHKLLNNTCYMYTYNDKTYNIRVWARQWYFLT